MSKDTNPDEALKQIQKYHWERWLKRPLGAFMLSLFAESITRDFMRKAGVDVEYEASIFQHGAWYKSPEVHKKFRKGIEKYLQQGGSIFAVSRSCEKFWQANTKRILEMQSEPIDRLLKNLVEFKDILNQVNAYVWLTYGFEEIYMDILGKEVSKYIKTDIQEFIREISVPRKKNAHVLLEDALAGDISLSKIKEQFGWIKSRDGFSSGFTISELAGARKKRGRTKKTVLKKQNIPFGLRELVREVQELVYFRTLRGDARSHLIFLMRPLLIKVARRYDIPFKDLKFYSVYDLIAEKPTLYPLSTTVLFYQGKMVYLNYAVVKEARAEYTRIKGTIGFPGYAKGRAKIVTDTSELKKVKEGDIMISQMTFPAFIIAMKKAAAFVTDEGGITSHTAIIAREMNKPCVIGTKIATQILKDGDMVEVDAQRGIVKKL